MNELHLVHDAKYLSSGLPPYDASHVYSQPAPKVSYPQGVIMDGPAVKIQSNTLGQNVTVTAMPLHQSRPSHGFAMCTMIFAGVTLILTFPSSILCTIPAMILSGLALARDYQVEEAKTMSWISLILTLVYYVCLVIAVIVIVAEVG